MSERLCPHITLPPTAYVPGQNTHPKNSFDGLWSKLDQFGADNWQEATPYLLGFDLYHAGYYWEAHEAWEEVWHLCKKKSPFGPLVQSLIFLTASRLKLRMGQEEQASRMAGRALELINDFEQEELLLGICLSSYKKLLQTIDNSSPFLEISWPRSK